MIREEEIQKAAIETRCAIATKSNNRAGGRTMNIIKRIKRLWYRLCNSDPVYNCPVYKNEGCAHVDGPLCVPSDCDIVHKYLGHGFVGCAACEFNDECYSKHYGLGCYNGSIKKE